MDKRLERILPRVQKPARYVGGEYNAVKKDPAQVDTRIAFCFPDTYEIGMSNLGMRILYGVMNNMEGVWCQRVFAPWGDMEEEMRRAGMPLFALESGEAITDFDIVAFSVGYEMAFPAILNMLDLANIPIHSAERTALTPLVIAGGTAMYNAEPIADFVDQAHRPGYGQVFLSHKNHCTLHGDRPGPGDAGVVPGLHPGVPVLSGGVCVSPRPQPQPGALRPVRRGGLQRLRISGGDAVQPVHQRLSAADGAVR